MLIDRKRCKCCGSELTVQATDEKGNIVKGSGFCALCVDMVGYESLQKNPKLWSYANGELGEPTGTEEQEYDL